jgi:hypothetical protein
MKKGKQEKPILPISLSTKKPNQNQNDQQNQKRSESLFTPYKIDWKTIGNKNACHYENQKNQPLQESNGGNSFFKNMKN